MSGLYLALGVTLGGVLGGMVWRCGGLSALRRTPRYLQTYRMPEEVLPRQQG